MRSVTPAPDRTLHRPAVGDPVAGAVVLHPHPAMGGDRDHPLVVALCERLAGERISALRIDVADPDPVAAAGRMAAAASELARDEGVERIVLLGYSWGAVVAGSCAAPGVVGRVLVAPPATMLAADPIEDDRPALVLVPAHDQYGPPDAVERVFGDRPDTVIEVVEGTDHFLAGAIVRIADRAVAWVTDVLAQV